MNTAQLGADSLNIVCEYLPDGKPIDSCCQDRPQQPLTTIELEAIPLVSAPDVRRALLRPRFIRPRTHPDHAGPRRRRERSVTPTVAALIGVSDGRRQRKSSAIAMLLEQDEDQTRAGLNPHFPSSLRLLAWSNSCQQLFVEIMLLPPLFGIGLTWERSFSVHNPARILGGDHRKRPPRQDHHQGQVRWLDESHPMSAGLRVRAARRRFADVCGDRNSKSASRRSLARVACAGYVRRMARISSVLTRSELARTRSSFDPLAERGTLLPGDLSQLTADVSA